MGIKTEVFVQSDKVSLEKVDSKFRVAEAKGNHWDKGKF